MKLQRFHTIFLAALAMISLTGLPEAVSQMIISPDPDSKMWIEGRSNVNRFSCAAGKYEGGLEVRNGDPDQAQSPQNEAISLELRIPVQSLECGRSRMNRDLYQALRSEEFTYIHFEFRAAEILSEEETADGHYPLAVKGILTVAGTSRDISFTATGAFIENSRLRVTGQKEIRMTDYNVEPPTGLFGIVKAEDELTVHFDLFATPEENIDTFEVRR